MSKTFTHVGTAVRNGITTYRYASGNPKVREGILTRGGFTDVVFYELPAEMTKEDAVAWLNEKGTVANKPRTGRAKSEGAVATPAETGAAELEATVAEETLTAADAEFFATQAGDNTAA